MAADFSLSATNSISNVKLPQNYTMPINYGNSKATVSGKTALSMGLLQNGGTYTNELELDISTYTKKSGSSLSWTKHNFVGNREDLVKSFNTPSLVIPDMVESLEKTVLESGLGITMKDLGFSNY